MRAHATIRAFRRALPAKAACALALAAGIAPGAGAQEAAPEPGVPAWFGTVSPRPESRPRLLGDAACAACHADKVSSFHETAHFKTSSWPSDATIRGSFSPGEAELRTVNPDLRFTLEDRRGGFYQTAHLRTSGTTEMERSERIDVVVGSGRKGQTYLFWDGDLLYELPVSYWTDAHGWVNSPGYADGEADFGRQIVPRCLECHGTSFDQRPPPDNRYGKESLVLGILCERCHGPGSEHAARFRSPTPPRAPADFAIVNPARLPRGRQLDVCALCHEGSGHPLARSLSFVPGDDLRSFIEFPRLEPNARIDVHASQVQLLERSKCFRMTKTLTCITCHDVHEAQRETTPFSAKCLACHKPEACGSFRTLGHAIEGKCVDCHMPLQDTGKIVSRVDGLTVRPKVRNHHIAVYPAAPAP